jgi:YVTN family beta-propeller protein
MLGSASLSAFRRPVALLVGLVAVTAGATLALRHQRSSPEAHLGKQADGTFRVSSGQTILAGSIAFPGRPSDLAMHPTGRLFAIMNKHSVFLAGPNGVMEGTDVDLGAEAGFRGLAWTPDGAKLIATTADGFLQTFAFDGQKLTKAARIDLVPKGDSNPVPGGMALTPDGTTMYIAAANLNAVLQVDLTTNSVVKKFPCETLPFEVKLTADGKTLVASNWGGKLAEEGDQVAMSQREPIVVDDRGAPSTGSATIIDLASGKTTNVAVGVHPTSVAVQGQTAYVANTLSDSVSVIDLAKKEVTKSIPIHYKDLNIVGAMPDSLVIAGDTLYCADGGDNALAVIDLTAGAVKGFFPAGYFPIAASIQENKAYVLNSKGNGSVAKLAHGRPAGNAHDFEGTVSVIDLTADLSAATHTVAELNGWDADQTAPNLAVYHGAIKHVLYIIKENRTFDEVFGDMGLGNGDPKLADIGHRIMPNHQALARQFTLFDNGYVSGTNSADGHAWSTQSLANDYLEHFYVGYSRTYPDDGDCAMSISSGGCIWDAAAKAGLSVRDWGEFADDGAAQYDPYRPKDWFEAWEDRKNGTHKFVYTAHTMVSGLRPYLAPHVHYWPLIQSDQSRADEFIKEYNEFSQKDTVPNLMLLSLPCDHTEGVNQTYPAPRSMMADNDLALGRVVEAVSKSPQWKNTCIFVIEDDAQSGPDHVDGHRTVYGVYSPYNKMHTVDSHLYTTTNMIKSIEFMLGFKPMNRFDTLAWPIDSCFNDTPDLTPYKVTPNLIALDERSPKPSAMTPSQRYWAKVSAKLDWSHLDGPNPLLLNRVIWSTLHPNGEKYPARPGENAHLLTAGNDGDE